ncbi:MAG: ammonium transporter [Cytophagales bacterium]|nr:MAG: ammonium transporter [Cytophagales bacterium]
MSLEEILQIQQDSLFQVALNDSLHQATRFALEKSNQELLMLKKSVEENSFAVNNLWMLIATALVFIMHLGFATLESGLTRAKNTTNVLFKNTVIPGIGILTFAFCGFGLMYPHFGEKSMDFIGFYGFGLSLPENGLSADYNIGYTYWTDFLFQAMFAATCATIVSGAVAERIKVNSFLVFSLLFVSLVYPVIGSWKWGGGWLNTLGFHDFAGSTLVHSVGGWAALAGVILLGPRLGKYENNRIKPITGHNMTSAVIGTFMLWLGWYGFNGGSVLSADPGAVSHVFVTTTLAAAAGGVMAAITIFILSRKYDLSMVLNGILSGLVGITAGADVMSPLDSVLIGAIAGVIVVFSVILFDKFKLDDPVGALSVHLVCGIWGTLAVGVFGDKSGLDQLLVQLTGIFAAGVTAFTMSALFFGILRKTMGLRIPEDDELTGLDYKEHGMEAYPNFNLK